MMITVVKWNVTYVCVCVCERQINVLGRILVFTVSIVNQGLKKSGLDNDVMMMMS